MRTILSQNRGQTRPWRTLFRRAVAGVLCLSLVLALSIPAEAATKKAKKYRAATHKSARYKPKAPPVDRYGAIVIDAVSGEVLSERNADKQLYPASLTKMMTLYLTFEAIADGNLRKNSRLPVSARAARQEPSKLDVDPGSSLRVEDAILGLVTKSANDAAVVLAEGIGGSEDRFAAMMTAKARALGMNNTRFVNASGLFDKNQVSSARDMAILGRSLMRDFPREYHYFSTPSFTFAGKTFANHNKLMNSYPGMDGLKTGYVHQSGFNLAASAVQGGRRLIGVVFGGRTTASRNATMAQLLNDGFAQLRAPRLAAARPQFDAMGLALKDNGEEQGEGDATEDAAEDVATPQLRPSQFRPKPISTRTLGAYTPPVATPVAAVAPASGGGNYVVQIGSFGNKAAGMNALKSAQKKIKGSGKAIVVPLITSRGTIYRARLSGLGRTEAENACRMLRGNCLILATP